MADQQSPDDMFEEERPDQLNHSVGQTALPRDNDPPAGAAATPQHAAAIPDDHPITDTEVDQTEVYQEGTSALGSTPEPETEEEFQNPS